MSRNPEPDRGCCVPGRHAPLVDPKVHFAEPRAAYDRVQLSGFFSGKSAEDLSIADADWFAEAPCRR